MISRDEIIMSEVKRFQGFYPETKKAYIQELGEIAMGITHNDRPVHPDCRYVAARLLSILNPAVNPQHTT